MRHTFSFPFFLFILLLSPFTVSGNLQKAFALTPVADLTGDWSGFAQIITTGDFSCTFSGNVNAHVEQNENNIDGNFSFVITDAQTTNPGAEYECQTFTENDEVHGTIDGSRITLHSSDGGTFSGWFASSGIHLDLASPDYTGTAQLSATGFSPPAFEPKDADGDGIPDSKDSCPNDPAYTANGCPEEDTDGDNIPDSEDACPNYSAPDTADGCPEEDTDGDNIPDSEDACPNYSAPDTADGCPENNDQVEQYAEPENSNAKEEWGEGYEGPIGEGVNLTDESQLAEWLSAQESKKEAAKVLIGLDPSKVKSVLEKLYSFHTRSDITAYYLEELSYDDVDKLPSDFKAYLEKSLKLTPYVTQMKKNLIVDKLISQSEDGTVELFKPTKSKIYDENPVFYVNGLNNLKDDTDDNAKLLAETLGRPVERVYNRSHGMVQDLKESIYLKIGNSDLTPAVYTLVEEMKNNLENGKPVEIHAHSQGAIITSNALEVLKENYPDLYTNNADKILVYTYGGAAFSFPDGPEYHHRMHVTDLIPVAALEYPLIGEITGDPSSSILWKAGSEELIRSGEGGLDWNFPGHAWIGYMKRLDEFAIADHKNLFSLDQEGLAKDMKRYSSTNVEKIFTNLNNSDKDNVAYYYLKNLNDNELKKLPSSTLKVLSESLAKGYVTDDEQNQIERILQLKK